MWTMLAGIPTKVKTLLDRLTSTRATKLDNIDVAISTRAPASTALSTAVWTNDHAAKIDAFPSKFILESPPIAAGWHVDTSNLGTGTAGAGPGNTIRLSTNGQLLTTAVTTWDEVISVTGKGVINFIAVGSYGSTATAVRYRLYVDGVLIATDDSTTITFWRPAVGAVGMNSTLIGGIAFDHIPFTASWKLDLALATEGSGRTAGAVIRYRRVE